MIPYKQLTLAEVFEDCQNKFDNDKYQFLSLLDQTINLDEIVPVSFVTHFHASTGRPRKHQLYPIIKALLIQRIFSIPTDTLLIIFLKYSQELRDFCGFRVVPDASKFTRFKQDFLMDLQSMFDHLVDITEPICQRIDSNLASMSIFDTSGIEAWVTENNPKYANRIIKQLKAFAKAHNFDPYKAAYGSMPTHAAANPAIQQMYINGHFCYAYKFGIVTNGLGIVRDITFYNKDFLNAHPDIIVEKKSDSPDEDKSLADSKALLPVLIDFFQKHPLINPKTFLGDAAFDTIEIYKALLDDLGFEKALIPLRTKLSMEEHGYTFNENGVPCCPHDSTLPMKREGSKSHLRSKLPSMKFVCP
ncbi:transposase, partial [Mediterraneibacter massiliensis]|uniref:transposase n=1 Tax=Mediterraneibacter massiliensis TaxID=1720300 RepID=UPI0022E68193